MSFKGNVNLATTRASLERETQLFLLFGGFCTSTRTVITCFTTYNNYNCVNDVNVRSLMENNRNYPMWRRNVNVYLSERTPTFVRGCYKLFLQKNFVYTKEKQHCSFIDNVSVFAFRKRISYDLFSHRYLN